MEATGSVLTNKYAEGYPGKRYYGGCEVVDEVENLAIERVKHFLGLIMQTFNRILAHKHTSVYHAFIKPGDKIWALTLPMVGILPTVRQSTSLAVFTMRCFMG